MSKLVILDPGHCIDTAGKCSPDGAYQEYEFNWDMVLKIEAHLVRSGVKVRKTREKVTDESSLVNRVMVANNSGATLFYSCHSNALDDSWSKPKGCGFYIYGRGGNAEKLAKSISDCIFPKQTNDFKLRNRGIYTQNLYVLRKTTMPAVLVENAFHTNKDDVKLLQSQAFRRKMSEYTAEGICKYLCIKYIKDSNNYSKYPVIKTGHVVDNDSLNVRYGPSMSNKIFGVLNPKCYVEILGETNGWYKIFYGSGFGYIHKNYVKINN